MEIWKDDAVPAFAYSPHFNHELRLLLQTKPLHPSTCTPIFSSQPFYYIQLNNCWGLEMVSNLRRFKTLNSCCTISRPKQSAANLYILFCKWNLSLNTLINMHKLYIDLTCVADKAQVMVAVSGKPFSSWSYAPTVISLGLVTCPVPVGHFSFFVVVIVWQGPFPSFVQAHKGNLLAGPNQTC